jgi:cell division protein FtsN
VAVKRNTRNSPNTANKNGLPWGPMFISFAVGAFIMFLANINDNPTADVSGEKQTKEKRDKKAVAPTFEFYTLLPEMEVVVDNNSKNRPTIVTLPTNPTTNPEQSVAKINYLLQVGSFRKASDADAYKAKLAFLGIESKVQKVTINNQDTWHRVQVGPIIGRDKADALQKKLEQNNIDSLLMRAKNG